MSSHWLAAVVSAVSCLLMLKAFVPVARKLGLVDHPQSRKIHERATPLVGGIAIFGGCVFGLLMVPVSLGEYRILFAAGAALLLVGLLDDLRELSARSRFAAQILATLAMVKAGGVELVSFGQLLDSRELILGALALPVTVFCTVGVINAVNMSDGVDGLSGGLVLVALIGLGAASIAESQLATAPLLCAVVAAVMVFLVMNFRPGRAAQVFLGDAGTLWLGFLLAWLFVDLSQGDARVIDPVTALWLLAIPLLDTVFVMIERPRAGESPFRAAQDHLHHLFLRAGFGRARSVLLILLLAIVFAGLGLAGQWLNIDQSWRFYGFIVMAAVYHQMLARAWRRRRWLGRDVSEVPAV
ncbi:MAG: MraY family glycosyltransferase [Lysobacterales bacterium]